MKRLIVFLVRKRLGLKKYEHFRFANQKTEDIYYFTETELAKRQFQHTYFGSVYVTVLSGVSLNWLLNHDCKIIKIEK